MAKTNRFLAKFKRKLAPLVPFYPRIFILVITAIAIALLIRLLPQLVTKLRFITRPSQAVLSLIRSPESVLQTTHERTNLLLLGKGGAGHEAPDLTDTLIFLSYHHPTSSILMVSLPRDLWVDSLKAKLNSAYYYGNLKQPGGGLILAKASVEEIIHQPVHYAVTINFDGFTQAIDAIGGVPVEVLRSFDDYQYPIPGQENAQPESSRYQHIHFDSGTQNLNGDQALKYVRSRNAQGEEGTDYARSARQQQLLLALQQKLLSSQIILNPSIIKKLTSIARNSFDSDIQGAQATAFIKLATGFKRDKLTSITLDQGDKSSDRQGLLINPSPTGYDGQWVLTGKDGSWLEVQQYISSLLN